MNLRTNIRGLLVALFTLLFVACYANATLFVHTHIIDGQVITHSHIYTSGHADSDCSDTQDDDMAHAPEQVALISFLNHLVYTDNVSTSYDLDFTLYSYSQYDYSSIYEVYIEDISAQIHALRGPPCLL